MKIYLAARFGRQAEMRGVRDKLVQIGHEVTSRWLTEEFSAVEVGRAVTEDDRRKWANYDYDDVRISDVVISFTEPSDYGCGRGGRHVEFGLAAAWGKKLIVVGHRENVFHYLPGAAFYESLDRLLAELFA